MKYTKLDHAILDSTVWREPAGTRLVWITCLAMADWDGKVAAAIPGLADRARVTLDECESALRTLLGPDPYSRTESNDGRRLVKVSGGWKILNFEAFRDASSNEQQRERTRERVRRHRERKRKDGNVTSRSETLRNVTKRHKDLDIYKSSKSSCDGDALHEPTEPAPDLDEQQRRQLDALQRARAALSEPHLESGSPDEAEQRQDKQRQPPEVPQ